MAGVASVGAVGAVAASAQAPLDIRAGRALLKSAAVEKPCSALRPRMLSISGGRFLKRMQKMKDGSLDSTWDWPAPAPDFWYTGHVADRCPGWRQFDFRTDLCSDLGLKYDDLYGFAFACAAVGPAPESRPFRWCGLVDRGIVDA